MYPQQPDRSIDYLNQIAPRTKTPLFNTRWIPIAIGALLLLGIIIIVVGSTHQPPNLTTQVTTLYARLQTLQTLSTTEQGYIDDTNLSASNSSLSLILSNAITEIGGALGGANKQFQVPSDVAAGEKTELNNLTTEMNNARLNVDLDSSYAREMAYQLSLIDSYIGSIERQNPSKGLLAILTTADNDLRPLQQTFANFTGAKE